MTSRGGNSFAMTHTRIKRHAPMLRELRRVHPRLYKAVISNCCSDLINPSSPERFSVSYFPKGGVGTTPPPAHFFSLEVIDKILFASSRPHRNLQPCKFSGHLKVVMTSFPVKNRQNPAKISRKSAHFLKNSA